MLCVSVAAVAVALLSVASASILSTTEREAAIGTLRDVNGNYALVNLVSGDDCPARIMHTGPLQLTATSIDHSNIRMDGVNCDDDGTMTLYSDIETATSNVEGNAQDLVDSISSIQGDLNTLVLGVESGGRTCGDLSFAEGALVAILSTSVDNTRIGVFTLNTGRRYMMISHGDRSCFYFAPLRPSASPSKSMGADTATVSPSLSPSESVTTTDTNGTGTVPVVSPPETSPSASPSVSPNSSSGTNASASISPDVSESEEPAPSDDDDGPPCFPADAVVELEDGSSKAMIDVAIGDRVKVATGLFSDVFMFTHKMSSVMYEFVTMTTSAGDKISATSGHYMYLNGQLAVAESVKIGDVVERGDGSVTSIVGIVTEMKTGLYNPQTVHGDIIVNNVRASTFTQAVEVNTAQALLTPLRMAYKFIGFSTSAFDNGSDMIAAMMPKGEMVV